MYKVLSIKDKLTRIVPVLLVALIFFFVTASGVDAAITQRGSVTTCTTASNDCKLNKPTGVVTNDIMVAFICNDTRGLTLSAPSGWTPAPTGPYGDTSEVCYSYYKVAVSGDSSSSDYTFTWSSTPVTVGIMVAYYSDIAGNGMVYDTSISYTQGSTRGTSFVLPAITTSAANEMLIGMYSSDDAAGACWGSYSASNGTPLVEIADLGVSSVNVGMAAVIQASAGTTGTKTAVCSTEGDGSGALMAVREINTAPTISVSPSASYGSWTRTGVNNTPFTVNFTATDAESTGANALTYYFHTGAGRTGTQVSTGTFTSGAASPTVAYDSSGLAAGSNTVYLSVYDGTNYSGTNPSFTVLRDDAVPTASTSISYSPTTVLSNNQYTVTFTPNDVLSKNTDEIAYNIRTAAAGGGTLLTSGTSSDGNAKTTGTITDNGLATGSNTRYVRVCDGASNCTDTSFTLYRASGGSCSSVPLAGNYTASSSCIFGSGSTTYDGVDNGSGTTNTGVITISSAQTMTVGVNQTLAYGSISKPGASIVKFSGGVLKKGPLWIPDADGDSYPDAASSANQIFQATQPSNYVRRSTSNSADCKSTGTSANLVWSSTTCYIDSDGDTYSTSSTKTCTNNSTCTSATYGSTGSSDDVTNYVAGRLRPSNGNDCLDSSVNIYANQSVAADTDQDGYGTSGASSQCAGASTTVSGRTYYKNSAGNYYFIVSGSMLGSSDCSDTNSTLAPTRTYYTDGDSDGYTASGGSECQTISTWGNSACTTAGSTYAKNGSSTCRLITSGGTDCLDSNGNVHPGQTSYFTFASANGYDYNCSGGEDKQYTGSYASSGGVSLYAETPYCVASTACQYTDAGSAPPCGTTYGTSCTTAGGYSDAGCSVSPSCYSDCSTNDQGCR